MRTQAIMVSVFVIIHHGVALAHDNAHNQIEVLLTPSQSLFVYTFILLLPIAAVILVWTRFAAISPVLLAVSMAGALIFGVYHHYILISPDNIAHLPVGTEQQHSQFVSTAHLLSILQLLGAVLAAYLAGAQRSHFTMKS